NGGGSGTSDAWQPGNFHGACGKATTVLGHENLRAPMQVARPSVVSESGPIGHDFFLLRIRPGGNIRETLQEALVVRKDGAHLRRLQHDFGQPDPIWIAGPLPREMMAAMLALPFTNAQGKIIWMRRRGHAQKWVLRYTDQRADSEPRMATTTPARTRLTASGRRKVS